MTETTDQAVERLAERITNWVEQLEDLVEWFVACKDVIIPAIANHFEPSIVSVCGCNGCLLQRKFAEAERILYEPRNLPTKQGE